MKDCDSCNNWTPCSGMYTNGCLSCQARMLAASHAAWVAYAKGQPGQLRGALERVWKDRQERAEGRLLIHRWYVRTRAT